MTTRIVYTLLAVLLILAAVGCVVLGLFVPGPTVLMYGLAALCAVMAAMFAHDAIWANRGEHFIQ